MTIVTQGVVGWVPDMVRWSLLSMHIEQFLWHVAWFCSIEVHHCDLACHAYHSVIQCVFFSIAHEFCSSRMDSLFVNATRQN